MSDYVVVPLSALSATADAIKEKLGTQEDIEFTIDGFKDAVDAISGSIDFSGIKQELSLNNIGGLFTAFINGTWDYQEKSFVSGTNPLTIDFGRPIKGFFTYPKSLQLSKLTGEATAFSISIFNDADLETGQQTLNWAINKRAGGNGGINATSFARISSWTLVDGVWSGVPTYPTNANFHPFRFNIPYIFVYWW